MRVLQLFLSLILATTCFGQYLKPIRGMPFVNRTHLSARGLVGLWLFNEGSGNIVSDLSGNGRNGTFVNTPIWVAGEYGSAIDFESGDSDYIQMNKGFSPGTDDFTLWFIHTQETYSQFATLFSSGTYNNGWVCYNYNDNAIRLNGGGINADLTYRIPAGKLVHIVVTRRSNVAYLYVDGVFITSAAQAGDFQATANIRIGVRSDGTRPIDGIIHAVGIYNRGLNDSEIAELYLRPFGMMKQPNPLLYAGVVEAPPPPSGQVITIIITVAPFFIIPAYIFTKKRKAA